MEVRLTIVKTTRGLKEPAPGKRFRTLSRGVKLSVTGETLPDWLVGLTGDGEAEVGAEVSANADLDAEGKAVLIDAAKTSVAQALDELVVKLKRGVPSGPPKAKATTRRGIASSSTSPTAPAASDSGEESDSTGANDAGPSNDPLAPPPPKWPPPASNAAEQSPDPLEPEPEKSGMST